MPTEIRHIIFDRDEVATAISRHRKTKGLPMSEDPIQAFTIVADPVRARLTLADGSDAELDEDALCLAVIEHCIHIGVPLPRQAEKSMQAFKNNVVLVMNLGEPPAAAAP